MSLAQRYSDLAGAAFFGYDAPDSASGAAQIARGDMLLDEDVGPLRSELPDVDDERWTQFTRALSTQGLSEVSESNGVGMFCMMPRRLADLGLVNRLGRSRSSGGRTIWVAAFVPPMTTERFLRSPRAQYDAFCRSVRDYDEQLRGGIIRREPGMSRSGALAILHRAGPQGLSTWRSGERFESTRRAYDRVAGVF